MCNKKNQVYIEKMLKKRQLIYIDTCSLLNIPAIDNFIKNYKTLFYMYNRKIIVPSAVCYELCRLLTSGDSEKVQMVLHVLELFSKNPDLFKIENENLTEENMDKAFADQEILQAINTNRIAYHQLLITNDRKLSSDAYKYNSFESVKGTTIWVCYINLLGELQPCECVTRKNDEKCDSFNIKTNKENDTCKAHQISADSPKENSVRQGDKSDNTNSAIIKTVYGLGGMAFGFFLGKYGKEAIQALRAAI